ncbi:MAG: S24 family peptidase [Candidatus Paceibacterota bacterium]
MHIIQQKILNLARERNLAQFTLRGIGESVGEPDSPQKIKHHLDQLMQKGLLLASADGKKLKPAASGMDKKSKIISLPIIGSANCGEALTFADEKIEGYLKVSPGILGANLAKRAKNLYVLRAIGDSMNRADIKGKSIEEGDYVLIDGAAKLPRDGEYVVSVINGLSNIKKYSTDNKNKRIMLVSESTQDIPPIYIHENDINNYVVCGTVIDIFKVPDELAGFMDASARDILNELGPMSKEEYDYYENL